MAGLVGEMTGIGANCLEIFRRFRRNCMLGAVAGVADSADLHTLADKNVCPTGGRNGRFGAEGKIGDIAASRPEGRG